MSEYLSKRNKKSDLYHKNPRIYRGAEAEKARREENALRCAENFSDHAIETLSDEQLAATAHMGPKWCFRNNLFDGEGWRAGYTKPTIQARKNKRRNKK